jgi:hypothetical protein
VYRYVVNRYPEKAGKLRQRLPTSLRAEIARLDLAQRDLSTLQAKLLLVHGMSDNIIPYTQSIALHQAVGAERSALYLLRGWSHVEAAEGVPDAWCMFRALYQLLLLRDSKER